VLKNKKRRASFALYAYGLVAEGERKSVEPIAARACPVPEGTDAAHQRLLHFLVDSGWSDRDVRREAAGYGIAAMVEREPIESWIVDDTGLIGIGGGGFRPAAPLPHHRTYGSVSGGSEG
jgi:SRSO17 transposase